jgi:hypothetical protein
MNYLVALVIKNLFFKKTKRAKAKAPFSNVTVFHKMSVIALLKISTVLSHRYNFNYFVFIVVHKSRSHSGKSARLYHLGLF